MAPRPLELRTSAPAAFPGSFFVEIPARGGDGQARRNSHGRRGSIGPPARCHAGRQARGLICRRTQHLPVWHWTGPRRREGNAKGLTVPSQRHGERLPPRCVVWSWDFSRRLETIFLIGYKYRLPPFRPSHLSCSLPIASRSLDIQTARSERESGPSRLRPPSVPPPLLPPPHPLLRPRCRRGPLDCAIIVCKQATENSLHPPRPPRPCISSR